jgi:hypothetical protein
VALGEIRPNRPQRLGNMKKIPEPQVIHRFFHPF